MNISILDWTIVVVYLAAVVGLGCRAGIVARRKGQKKGESEAGDFFMAAHTLKWPVIGLALFATNISCVHLVSLAQSGYDTGLLNGNFEWMAAFTLILLGFFFAPFYLKSKVATLPDFLEKRYCRECRDWLAIVSILAAIIFHIAFPLATGWLILHDIFGIEKWTCIVLMCTLTGIYTVAGGLAAVAITETIQTVVLLLGAFVITWFAWQKTGGWSGMTATLDIAPGGSDGQLMSMLRPHGDSSGMPVVCDLPRLSRPRHLVLVRGPDDRPARARRAERERRARGFDLLRPDKDSARLHLHRPRVEFYTAIKQERFEGVSQIRVGSTATASDGKKEQTLVISGALANPDRPPKGQRAARPLGLREQFIRNTIQRSSSAPVCR